MMYVINGKEYFVNNYLMEIFRNFHKRQKKKWDNWVVFSGLEGDGKSRIAIQSCTVMSHLNGKTFENQHIAFTPDQFSNCIDNAENGQSILFDEAITGLASTRVMSKINYVLRTKAAMCRKKQLFVGIVLPSFFDLEKNIAIHRTRALIHVYTKNLERGLFSYYTMEKKKMLYVLGKKFYDMSKPKPEFRGNFGNWLTINEDQYEEAKDKATENFDKEDDGFNKWKVQRDAAFSALHTLGWSYSRIATYITESTALKIEKKGVDHAVNSHRSSGKLLVLPQNP